jgi:triosephosphate isomerase
VRPRIVVGNWKMNPASVADAVELARAVAALSESAVRIGVAPPAVALAAVAGALSGGRVGVYAQDVHWEDRGAFTGQLSAAMLRGLATGAIVGHSEVRRDQCDDDTRVARKLARAVAAGLRPILCVGESETAFAAGESTRVVARQIAADLAELSRGSVGDLVVAYEPIWAIGTGRNADAADAGRVVEVIRTTLADRYDAAVARSTRVQYGGSVKPGNIAALMAMPHIDGALVGGASLDPDEFARIVKWGR